MTQNGRKWTFIGLCFLFLYPPHPSFAHPLPQGARGIKVTFGNFENIAINYFMSFIHSMNDISFKSNIRIVSPNRFEKISHYIYRNNGELIGCYDLDTCFRGIDFQAYRTKMKAGFTKGVRSCTCGLIVAKDKKTSSFFHLFNSIENILHLNKIKNLFDGNNCILIGGKEVCSDSAELFNNVNNIAEKSKLPTTIMYNLANRFEADIAYLSSKDTIYLCVKDIFNPKNYAKNIEDLKLVFKEFKISEKDNIIPLNQMKEFFENLLDI